MRGGDGRTVGLEQLPFPVVCCFLLEGFFFFSGKKHRRLKEKSVSFLFWTCDMLVVSWHDLS